MVQINKGNEGHIRLSSMARMFESRHYEHIAELEHSSYY